MYQKNSLSTGDLVKILGTTKNTLFHYDRLGLFCPAEVQPNGYRAYSYRQLEQFCAIAYLRKIGMPLKEIRQYMQQRSPERLQTLLHTQLEEVRRKLTELREIEDFLEDHLEQLEELQKVDFEKIALVHLPARLLYCSPPVREGEEQDELFTLGKFFSEMLALTWPGAMVSTEELRQGTYAPYCYYSPAEEVVEGVGHMETRPAGTYLVSYQKGTQWQAGHERLLEYAKAQGLTVGACAYEEYLASELDVSDSEEYVTRFLLPVIED